MSSSALHPPLLARVALGAAAAAVVNVIVVTIAQAVGASMKVETPQGALVVDWLPAILASVLPLLMAGVVVWLLTRRRPSLRVPLAWVGLVFAVLSSAAAFVGPDPATVVALIAMHIITGIAWFLALTVRSPRKENTERGAKQDHLTGTRR